MTRSERLKKLAEMAHEIGTNSSDEEIAGLAVLIMMLAKELDKSAPEK